jgi:hypothetical protein
VTVDWFRRPESKRRIVSKEAKKPLNILLVYGCKQIIQEPVCCLVNGHVPANTPVLLSGTATEMRMAFRT